MQVVLYPSQFVHELSDDEAPFLTRIAGQELKAGMMNVGTSPLPNNRRRIAGLHGRGALKVT